MAEARVAGHGGNVYVLILLNGRLDDQTRAFLTAQGVKLLGFYPHAAYLNNPTAPGVDIIAYAYDASGTRIQMGQTPVPEPSSVIALAAFSALTLGTADVRRLKALQN